MRPGWLHRSWKWIAAGGSALLAAAAALVTIRWLRKEAPTDTARDLADENIDRARDDADRTRAEAEAEARKRVAASAVEAEKRSRELSRGAVRDPNGVLNRHSRGPGCKRDRRPKN